MIHTFCTSALVREMNGQLQALATLLRGRCAHWLGQVSRRSASWGSDGDDKNLSLLGNKPLSYLLKPLSPSLFVTDFGKDSELFNIALLN